MPKCSQCEKEFEKLESWGYLKLCESCAKKYREHWPKRPKGKISNVEIDKPRIVGGAQYVPDSGNTRIRGSNDGNQLFETLNHEVIHFVLHKLIDFRCCYQYDSIQEEIDCYHHSLS